MLCHLMMQKCKEKPRTKPDSRFPAGLPAIDYACVALTDSLTQGIFASHDAALCFYLICLTNRSKLIIPVMFSNLFMSQTCVVAETVRRIFLTVFHKVEKKAWPITFLVCLDCKRINQLCFEYHSN